MVIPSGQRKLYLTRYLPKFAVICLDTDSDPLVNFMWCRDMATSVDTLPLEMLCQIFSFLGSDVLLVRWNISRPWHLVITQWSCRQKEGVWLQISNLEISHADTPSTENYLKTVFFNSLFCWTPFSGLKFSLALNGWFQILCQSTWSWGNVKMWTTASFKRFVYWRRNCHRHWRQPFPGLCPVCPRRKKCPKNKISTIPLLKTKISFILTCDVAMTSFSLKSESLISGQKVPLWG